MITEATIKSLRLRFFNLSNGSRDVKVLFCAPLRLLNNCGQLNGHG